MNNQDFTPIPGHERYEINKRGIIRNSETGKIKSQYLNDSGYFMVSFSYNNKSNSQRVHRLLAKTFIPNPEKKPHINHKNGVKTDNDIKNLQWVTIKENNRHGFSNDLIDNTGSNNGMSKLNEEQVKRIKKLLENGETQQSIADKFCVSRSCILRINLGETWSHIDD